MVCKICAGDKERKYYFPMKKTLTIILLLSLLGNAGLLWLAKQQYQEINAIRLDPMQLDVYKTQPDDNDTLGKKRIVFFGTPAP